MTATDSQIAFGKFTFVEPTRTLWFDGVPVPLRPKEAQLLALLLNCRPNAIRRDELIAHLWGSDGTDAALNQTVYRLRSALAKFDSSEYIRTHPHVGFQLVAGANAGLPIGGPRFRREGFADYQAASLLYDTRGEAALWQVIQVLRDTVRRDPAFVSARTLLARAYATAGIRLFYSPVDAYWQARKHLAHALTLEPKHSAALAVLSVLHLFFIGSHEEARETVERALLLAPNAAHSHSAAMWERLCAKDFSGALSRADCALEIYPQSAHFTYLAGVALYMDGSYCQAIDVLTTALALDRCYVPARFYRACAYCMTGDFQLASADLSEISGNDYRSRAVALDGVICARTGDVDGALQRIVEIEALPISADLSCASVYIALNDFAQAERSLRRALVSREPGLFMARIDPIYGNLYECLPDLVEELHAGRGRQCDRCASLLPGEFALRPAEIDLCVFCRDALS